MKMQKSNDKYLFNITLSAMFIAIGLVLPFLTGQLQTIGNMLLPMHIPVLLCGLICAWQYGLCIGTILPLMRSLLFGMPIFYPSAIAMAFELAVYGFIVGLIYGKSKWKCLRSLYRSMLAAMLSGRIVWGIVMVILLGVKGGVFTFSAFIAGAFTNAVPGIILQLIFIPGIMIVLGRTKMVKFSKKTDEKYIKEANIDMKENG